MFAASVLKLYENYKSINSDNIGILLTGNVVSFIVAMIAIKTFINFLTNHGFKVFGYYRIFFGAIILILLISGYQLKLL
jgi:undecaprenyl-diphosphatase